MSFGQDARMGDARRRLRSGTPLLALFAALAGGCATSRDGVVSQQPTRVTVLNETPDSLELQVNFKPRGVLAPEQRLTLDHLDPGTQVVVAESKALVLLHRKEFRLAPGDQEIWVIRPQRGSLRVVNPTPLAFEVLVDGSSIGVVGARGDKTFEKVLAGKRTLLARQVGGPLEERNPILLRPDAVSTWSIPQQAVAPVVPSGPRPPAGKGLVLMTNKSASAVEVFVDGQSRGIAQPGAELQLVVEPGRHRLQATMVGVQVTSESVVDVKPDQVAEWAYGD